MIFLDRRKAGKQLAEKVGQFLRQRPELMKKGDLLVVGLPRGGVPVALEVARTLACPLDVLAAKKLPYPGHPEYAIGAVSSDGIVVLNPSIPEDEQWKRYVEQQRGVLLEQTKITERQFYERARLERPSFKGRVVIIVDDGMATGMTAVVALESARKRGASATIIAAPVISSDTYRELQTRCDAVIALSVPQDFKAVGQYYLDFEQTSDREVVEALSESSHFVSGKPLFRQEPTANHLGN